MSQIETFAVGVVFQDFHQQLLANEDITAVQFRTVIRGFEQLLSQSHGNEWVEVQTALIQSLQLKSNYNKFTFFFFIFWLNCFSGVPFLLNRQTADWCS